MLCYRVNIIEKEGPMKRVQTWISLSTRAYMHEKSFKYQRDRSAGLVNKDFFQQVPDQTAAGQSPTHLR